MSDQENLRTKTALVNLVPSIRSICEANSTPGLSLGILHNNNFYHAAVGCAPEKVPSRVKTGFHTIFHIASVGKFITALAISNLVHEGLIDWDVPLQTYLPEGVRLHPVVEVCEEVTIRHCLIHTTGLSAQNRLWLGEKGRMNFSGYETLICFQGLERLEPAGQSWIYNNWGYALAGMMIQRLTGKSWGVYLKETIFDPLKMNDTTTDAEFMGDDVALGYMTLADGNCIPNGRPEAGDNTCQAGASGIQSSAHDLLHLYREVFTDELKLFHVAPLLEKQVDLGIRETIDRNEQSYAMGWVRTQLPGVPSMSPRDRLVIGRATASEPGAIGPVLLHHNGNYPGYTAASFLIPETKTAVVVLTNSVGKIEVAEIVGQMIVETMLNQGKTNIPYIDWEGNARREVAAYNQMWATLGSKLEEERQVNTTHQPLQMFVGRYYNSIGNWFMEIFLAPKSENAETVTLDLQQSLWMCMQGQKKEEYERYELKHYHFDVFSWLITLDDCASRGRSPICSPQFYLLKFDVWRGMVKGLRWSHDSSVKDSFFKKKG